MILIQLKGCNKEQDKEAKYSQMRNQLGLQDENETQVGVANTTQNENLNDDTVHEQDQKQNQSQQQNLHGDTNH